MATSNAIDDHDNDNNITSHSNNNNNKTDDGEDEYTMSRVDVVHRRSERLKQLSNIYRDFYWCLIEEVKLKHRDFVWQFPSFLVQDQDDDMEEENNNNNNNNNSNNTISNCEVHSCKKRAMALTRFCHAHILFDANQVLYKGCKYPTKSSPSGPTLCMKPILKSAVPALCSNHLEKAEKHLNRCLRKEGSTGFGSNKHPLKLNVVISEFVRQIQTNRREKL